MSELIDSIAKIIDPAGWSDRMLSIPVLGKPAVWTPTGDRLDHLKHASRAKARRILLLLREPTEAAIEAGAGRIDQQDQYDWGAARSDAKLVWQAMIDTALKAEPDAG